MQGKVLFLDFDGVLHPTDHGAILLSQLPTFESVVENHDCSIVISSSWRFHHDLVELKKHFSAPIREQIIGVTGDAYIGAFARFHEINAYVEYHGIQNWRALDDFFWEFPQGCSNLIRCNPNTGLSIFEVNQLQAWLEG
jgi:hypothetical protein